MANKQFIAKHGIDVQRTDGTSSLSIASDTGAVTMGQALSTTSTIESGAKLTVAAGGADINGTLDAKSGLNVTGGNLVVTNNLTVHGTTTTVNSTTVTIKDPVMEIGDNGSDDDLDRGVQFHYHNGTTAKFGFMGFDDSTGKFAFIPDAAAAEGGLQKFSGSAGTLVAALEGNADTATAFSSDRTLTITADDINGTSSTSSNGTHNVSLTIGANKVTFAKFQTVASMKVVGNVTGGTANAAEITIDSDMAGGVSASHDSLASAKTIKDYVDAQLTASNTIEEMTDTEISGIAQAHMLIWDHDQSRWENKALSGDVTMTKEGVATIGALSVENGMLVNDSVSFGGVSCDLGAAVAQPTFNLANATAYPTSSLVGTITDAQLAGSITDGKLDKDYIQTSEVDGTSIAFGGGTLNVVADGIDATHIDWGDYSANNTKIDTDVIPEGDTNLFHTTARARASIPAPTVTNPDSMGNFAYNNTSGVFTFTGATATETRAHFTAVNNHNNMGGLGYAAGVYTYTGPTAAETQAHFSVTGTKGLTYSNGAFALTQDLRDSAAPTFAGLTITDNLVINGTTTTVDAVQVKVEDPVMLLASANAADSRDIGLVGKYVNTGTSTTYHAALFRDATDGKWKILKDSTQADIATANEIVPGNGSTGTLVADLEGDVTGALTGNADTATTLAATRTFAITGGGITAAAQNFNGSGNVSLSASIDNNAVTLGKMAQLATMKVVGNLSGGTTDPAAVSVDSTVTAGSATALVTQAGIKAYVDAEIQSAGSMDALNDTALDGETDAHVLIYDDTTDKWENQILTGDVTMTKDGVTSIGATKVTNAMLAGSIADSNLNTITTGNKVSGSAVQLAGTSALEDSTGLQLKAATAGDGLAMVSQVLSVNTGAGLTTDSDDVIIDALGVTNAMLAGSIADSKLNTITTADKVSGSAVQLAAQSAMEDSTGLRLKAATAGDGLAMSAAQVLSVNVGAGLETNSDTIRIAADSVTNAMILNETFSISGKSAALGANADLDALTSASNALTMSGDYNGSAARTVTLTLADANALEVVAGGLDLKDTIAGVRTFSDKVTASAGVSLNSVAELQTATYAAMDANAGTADSFSTAFRSAKYVVQVTRGTDYQCSELLVIHDGTTAHVAEYGLIHTSASALMTFDVDIDNATVRLRATGANGDAVKMTRSTIVA